MPSAPTAGLVTNTLDLFRFRRRSRHRRTRCRVDAVANDPMATLEKCAVTVEPMTALRCSSWRLQIVLRARKPSGRTFDQQSTIASRLLAPIAGWCRSGFSIPQ